MNSRSARIVDDPAPTAELVAPLSGPSYGAYVSPAVDGANHSPPSLPTPSPTRAGSRQGFNAACTCPMKEASLTIKRCSTHSVKPPANK